SIDEQDLLLFLRTQIVCKGPQGSVHSRLEHIYARCAMPLRGPVALQFPGVENCPDRPMATHRLPGKKMRRRKRVESRLIFLDELDLRHRFAIEMHRLRAQGRLEVRGYPPVEGDENIPCPYRQHIRVPGKNMEWAASQRGDRKGV